VKLNVLMSFRLLADRFKEVAFLLESAVRGYASWRPLAAQIEASFQEAIRIAKEQKSVSLEKRAEATYAEYHRQKASGSGGRGFRLPLW
jgi:Ser/Thr protein kinase RdoA (MazF antagonist)